MVTTAPWAREGGTARTHTTETQPGRVNKKEIFVGLIDKPNRINKKKRKI